MIKIFFLFVSTFFVFALSAQKQQPAFDVIPLGVKGGLDESNLSAYMIAPAGSRTFICTDAGTVRYGIEKALQHKLFKTSAETVLKTYIKGYLISHAHLDHVAGLVMNSPDDTTKNIYAFPYIINTLSDKYFSWQNWANFANEGEKPLLNKYQYVRLAPEKTITLEHTGMSLTAFVLSHSAPYESSAFLLESKGEYLLYLGDTGADSIEHSSNLNKVWNAVASIIKNRKLKAIFIEVSFPDEQPDKQLFGHLTPKWLMEEMNKLALLAGKDAIKQTSIVITHMKPSGSNEKMIRQQLARENVLGLKLKYPVQGKLMHF